MQHFPLLSKYISDEGRQGVRLSGAQHPTVGDAGGISTGKLYSPLPFVVVVVVAAAVAFVELEFGFCFIFILIFTNFHSVYYISLC